MTKVIVLGGNYFVLPLVARAKERGFEVHVVGNAVIDQIRTLADKVHDFSILDTDKIVSIGKPDAICSVAVDAAVKPIAYLNKLWGLTGNSIESAELSTDKYKMKDAFNRAGVQCAKAVVTNDLDFESPFTYPVIVKPVDRSGSRGISKVYHPQQLPTAIKRATGESLCDLAILEEFIPGQEYSAEFLSWEGEHTLIQVTEKYTAEHFVEAMHIQPAELSSEKRAEVNTVIGKALTALRVEYGASHSEFKITHRGELKVIEIGARMGAEAVDKMVKISTGFDFIDAVIDTALGHRPVVQLGNTGMGVTRFVLTKDDLERMPKEVVDVSPMSDFDDKEIVSNEMRYGHYVFSCRDKDEAMRLVGLGFTPHEKY